MELIDKQEAIDMILGQPPELHYPVWYAGQIMAMTPVQPKIIYCKDCKHRDPEDRRCDCGAQWCALPKEDDDFCSYAERKRDGLD